ncbi:MAG: hypothetical protein AB1500_09685 [Bacillota bacterium]
MKRFLAFWLAAVLVLALLSLAGCGGGSKSETEKPTAGTAGGSSSSNEEISAADLFSKGKQIKGMSYDYIYTMPQETMSGKIWIEGKSMKSESTVSGQKVVTIINGDTNTMYTYYPDQNTAMKFTSPEQSQEVKTPTEYTDTVDPNVVKYTKTEVYDGARCRVYLVENQTTKEQVKMWVREDCGIPVRVETTLSDGTKMTMEYKNLEIGSLPSGTFDLPAGVKVTDMNDMMNTMPKMPDVPGQ